MQKSKKNNWLIPVMILLVPVAYAFKNGNKILRNARYWLGYEEKPNNTGFYSTKLEQKMKDVGFRKGYQYCVWFVKMVLKQSLNAAQKAEILPLFSGSSISTWNRLVKKKDRKYYYFSKNPVPGSIAFYLKDAKAWKGHAEIVDKVNGNNFKVISGNTTLPNGKEGIAEKTRHTSLKNSKKFKLLGFIIIKN